jgi:outer membrane protein assembly factor BamD
MKRRLIALSLVLFALTGTGCFGPTAEEKLREELLSLTKEQAFEKGKGLIAEKKWDKGRKYLSYVYENYASDPISREALLRLADSYFDEATDTAYVEGLYRYRDYQNRFPNRPESDYVLMRIGDCLYQQSAEPDRDQTNTRKALKEYDELLRLYPETLRRNEVVEKIKKCRALLANHELAVGRFYVRRGFTDSAIGRLSALLRDYPDFEKTDETLYWLVRSCGDLEQWAPARFYRKRLETEFPGSEWTSKAPVPPEESPEEGSSTPATK